MINTDELKECVIEDLKNQFSYTQKKAEDWYEQHAEDILDDMYDAYTHYIEEEA